MVSYLDADRSASATTLKISGSGFLNDPSATRIYLQATNGVDGDHLAYVRAARFNSTDFMIDSISGLQDPENVGPLRAVL